MSDDRKNPGSSAGWERLPRYTGGVLANPDYHHGEIPPARGVKCVQAVRANRKKEEADGTGTTYKHAPDLAYFHGRFYIQYLCSAVDEHEPGGFSVLASSEDGIHFTYRISFPPYRLPRAEIRDYKGLVHRFDGTEYGFMHQRMGFYKSQDGRMLLCGFYGWSPERWMTNWDNYGIGRVVRELYADGELGDIYFILPNDQAGWSRDQLNYPMYTECEDEGFVRACTQLLSDSLYVQQWAEENGDSYEGIRIKHPASGTYQAFCWYHITDQVVVGLWKHSFAAVSRDGGKTWGPVSFVPSLVMSGQKIWGQRTSDGKFALVYDPTLETQHRWPMCVAVGEDGFDFGRLYLLHGHVPPMRYGGFWKDYGPQYVRGIQEGLADPADMPDNSLYVTYSVNKEDIWLAKVPVPVTGETDHIGREIPADSDVCARWNLYCPAWSECTAKDTPFGTGLYLENREPCDCLVLKRMLKEEREKELWLTLYHCRPAGQGIYIELLDGRGHAAVQIILRAGSREDTKDGYLCRMNIRTTTELFYANLDTEKPCMLGLKADCTRYELMLTIRNEEGSETGKVRFLRAAEAIGSIEIRIGSGQGGPNLNDDPEKVQDMERGITEQQTDTASLYVMEAKEGDI